MPETVDSVSTQVHNAVEAAVSQASGSNPADGTDDSSRGTSDGASPSTADASSLDARTTAPSTTGGPTIEGGDADDEIVRDNNVWLDTEKRARVIRNAREREAEKIRGQIESQLGFKVTDENTLKNIQWFTRDPIGYIKQFSQHYGITPAQAAAEIAAPPQAGKTNGFARPTPQYRTEDGKAVYGQEEIDAIFDHFQAQLASVNQSISPIQKTHEQMETARQQYTIQQEADRIYADVQKWPKYEEIKIEMANLLMSDGRVTPESAYGRIMREKYPSFLQKTRQEVLDELKAKPPAPSSKATPAAQARSSSSDRSKGLSVHEAVLAAVEKHSATR